MKEEDFVEGIYHYCDGWCEKCTHTSKCSLFATKVKDKIHLEDLNDEDNSEFWSKLHDLFSETYSLLVDLAKEHDIDISDIEKMEINMSSEEDEENEEVEETIEESISDIDEEENEEDDEDMDDIDKYYMDDVSRKIVNSSVLVELCNKYKSHTEDWFNTSDDLLNKREDSLNELIDMDILGVDVEKLALPINDAVDVISWYVHLIRERVKKSLFDKMDSPEGYGNDYNGSAKICLLGIDRSIVAWSSLYEQFEETEDKVLNILLILSELRKKMEEEFPDARLFVREGLD